MTTPRVAGNQRDVGVLPSLVRPLASPAVAGSVQHFVEAVLNDPTLAGCYTTAALDGLSRLDSWQTAAPAPMGAPSQ